MCVWGGVTTRNDPVSFPYSYIYTELFCVRPFFWVRNCPSLEFLHAWRPSWSGLSRGGSVTGPLNMTCCIDTTSGLLFSLCNWADNVP